MNLRHRIIIPFEWHPGWAGTLSMSLKPEEKDCLIIGCDVRKGFLRYGSFLLLDLRYRGWEKFCTALVKVVEGKRRRAVFRADESATFEVMFADGCHWLALNAYSRWHSNVVFPGHLEAHAQKHRFSPGRPSGWALEAVLVSTKDMQRLKRYCLGVLNCFNGAAEAYRAARAAINSQEEERRTKLKATVTRWQQRWEEEKAARERSNGRD